MIASAMAPDLTGADNVQPILQADAHERGGRPGRILVVDDVEANRDLLTRMLTSEGHVVETASDGQEALQAVAREHPDLILLDVVMPGPTGLDVCRTLKKESSTRLIPVVLITALQDSRDKIAGIDAGADDFITKPFNMYELRARVRSLLKIKRYTDDLDTADSVIVSLALTIEARDPCTEGHCQRLAVYATALGTRLGLDGDDLEALERGGFLHDIGKVGIPDSVLLKPGALTREEHEQMKKHTLIGDRLCGELRSLRRVRPIVRSHHELLDGSGYPDRLRGDSIPLLAQVMGIVDVFDALTTIRPYKDALSAQRAHDELLLEAHRGWRQPELVETFIDLARQSRWPDNRGAMSAGSSSPTINSLRIR
jgi:putative two-component system response regulator